MKINKEGLNLIKKFECGGNVNKYLKTYKCPAGVSTIGYGHTGTVNGKKLDYKKPITITKEKAEELLKKDLEVFEKAVEKVDKKYGYKFNENEFSALVSFTFNCGEGCLITLVQSGRRTKKQIHNAIGLYNKDIHGRTLNGLTNRRIAEQKLFKKKVK